MKKCFALPLTLLLLIAGTSLSAQKIGYTNVELILAYMPEAKKVQTELRSFTEVLEGRIRAKETYLQSLMDEYYENVQANRYSPEQTKAKEAEIKKVDEEIQATSQDAEMKILARQQELMEPILSKIQTQIDAIAKEGGYTYILNQTSGSNILYGVETLDVTKSLAAKLGVTLPAEK